MAGFQFVSPDIAVDIGTDNTRVYVKGQRAFRCHYARG